MKYYISSPEMASGISHIKAIQNGCTGVTQFWWEVINHPVENLSAIVFTDAECELEDGETEKVLYQNPSEKPLFQITTDEIVDYDYMIKNGWFVNR